MTPAEPPDYRPPPDPGGALWVIALAVLVGVALSWPLWIR